MRLLPESAIYKLPCPSKANPLGRLSRANVAERIVLTGDVPSPIDKPSGCPFHPRCGYATDLCRTERPPLADRGDGRQVACHHPLDAS